AMERVENLPGVEAVGAISDLPMTGESKDTYFTIAGRALADPNQKPVANFRAIGHNYFRAMQIPLLKGRYFSDQDDLGVPVVIINEALARSYFPAEDPVGKQMIIDVGEPLQAEIVGVVGNVRHFLLEVAPLHEMYLPFNIFPETNLVVRTKVAPLSLAGAVRNEIRALDKDQPISQVRTMDQLVANSVADSRFRTVLLSVFAGLALVLAIVGIYGVISYSVSQRTQEIGVRMALGAQRSDIIKLVMRHGLILTLLGLAGGVLVSVGLTQYIASLLFEVRAVDWITYLSATLLLAMVALLASYVPARRAAGLHPTIALRNE
ncbi:MAG: FtsX-like permease family protein, partial [Pyrinomonadaceae bacterium]